MATLASFVRWLFAGLVCLGCALAGWIAVVLVAVLVWLPTMSSDDGLITALFVVPVQAMIGAIVGALLGIWPARRVLTALRPPEAWETAA